MNTEDIESIVDLSHFAEKFKQKLIKSTSRLVRQSGIWINVSSGSD